LGEKEDALEQDRTKLQSKLHEQFERLEA